MRSIRQSRLPPPIVTPVDLLHKASLSTCWSYLNLSAQNYPHLLDQAASTGPLALRTGQRVALGTAFSHRIRGGGLCSNTTWRELCFRTPIPRAPPSCPGGRPHSQRTVWKAQRGCFSKLSPNLRTRSRLSICEVPAIPFIILLRLQLCLGHRRSLPSANSA